MYNDQWCDITGNCWSKKMNTFIDKLGYSNVQHNFNVNFNYFHIFRTRSRDQYFQEWQNLVNTNGKLESYVKVKKSFGFKDCCISKLDNQLELT